jgi:hypothetical protein
VLWVAINFFVQVRDTLFTSLKSHIQQRIKLAVAILVVVVAIVYSWQSHSPTSRLSISPSLQATVATDTRQTPQTFPHLGVGDIGTIDDGSGSLVTLSSTKDGYDEMAQAGRAHDTVGIRQLVLMGRVFVVPVGTQARVIDTSFAMRRVRILDGKHKDAAGWLPFEYVK